MTIRSEATPVRRGQRGGQHLWGMARGSLAEPPRSWLPATGGAHSWIAAGTPCPLRCGSGPGAERVPSTPDSCSMGKSRFLTQ